MRVVAVALVATLCATPPAAADDVLLPGLADLSVLPGSEEISCGPNKGRVETSAACVSIERTEVGEAALSGYFSALETLGWNDGLEYPDRFLLDKEIAGTNCVQRLVVTLPDYETSPQSARFLLRMAPLNEPVCGSARDE